MNENPNFPKSLFFQLLEFSSKNKSFLWLPLLGFFLNLFVIFLLALDIYWTRLTNGEFGNVPQYYWFLQLISFFFLVALLVAINSFSSAILVYLAYFKLLKQPVALQDALSHCWSQRKAILSWGFFYTAAGFILSIVSRIKRASSWILQSGNIAWHIISFLIMPYVVIGNLSPSQAFKQASRYSIESAVWRLNIYLVLLLCVLPLILPTYVAFNWGPSNYQPLLKTILIGELLSFALLGLLWGSALNAIFKAALYLQLEKKQPTLPGVKGIFSAH